MPIIQGHFRKLLEPGLARDFGYRSVVVRKRQIVFLHPKFIYSDEDELFIIIALFGFGLGLLCYNRTRFVPGEYPRIIGDK